ncbi:BON domain-containing protein [Inquilinus limosus]|uniref:BON domain-containing protein n=1 Tax=Inquilinus limosus TaxID=171674 RepID=UPI0003F7EBE9|nr:BON domain-containing protein [Inquilinus limosus]
MDTDKSLQRLVLEELDYEPSIDAAEIGVAVTDGVVTLSGHVSNHAQKLAAAEAALRIEGVRAVVQDITVRLSGDEKLSDEEIGKRAVAALEWHSTLPAERIHVTVEHGVVRLTGDLDWQCHKREAEHAVEALKGVVAVINAIRVNPAHRMASVPEVRREIEAALKRSADLDASHIVVAASDGKISLSGKVRASFERDAAEIAAWSVPGVIDVENRVEIQP